MNDKRLAEVGMIICNDLYGRKVSVDEAIKHFEVDRDYHQKELSSVKRQIRVLKQHKKYLEGE